MITIGRTSSTNIETITARDGIKNIAITYSQITNNAIVHIRDEHITLNKVELRLLKALLKYKPIPWEK